MFSIDWVAYTVKGKIGGVARLGATDEATLAVSLESLLVETAFPSQPGDIWESCESGLFGYDRSYISNARARIMWHTTRMEMGIHVVLPGAAMGGVDAARLLADIISIGGTVTRVDICYDDKTTNATSVETYARRYESGDYLGRKRKFSEVTSNDGGHTLYIGSRQSEQFMRIYNKAAERHIAGDWIRVELELKSDAAHGFSKWVCFYQQEIEKGDLNFSGIIKSFAVFDGTSAWDSMDGGAIAIARSEKGDRKTREWAIGVVKTQASLLRMHPDFKKEIERAFAEEGIDITVRNIGDDLTNNSNS